MLVRASSRQCGKRKDSNSWKKSAKDLSLNYGKEEESKKGKNSNSTNKSTLSLHISTYENSVKAESDLFFGDKNDEILHKQSKKLENKKQAFIDSKAIIQNPFEFPRQQESAEIKKAEIAYFKANQRLANPNPLSINQISSDAAASRLSMPDSNYTIPDESIPTQCVNIKIAMEFSNVQQPSIFDKLSVLSEETPTKIEISKSACLSSHDNAKISNLRFGSTAFESEEISELPKRVMPEPQKSENSGASKDELQGHDPNVMKFAKHEMAGISKREKPVPLKRRMSANASNDSGSSDKKSNGNEEMVIQKLDKPQLPERQKPAKDERSELPKTEKPERVKRILGELPKRVMLPKDKKPKFPQLVMGDNKTNGIESILNEACPSEISDDNEEDATTVSKVCMMLHLTKSN
uniref:Uncharacterized protein n=1 Tax=Panagrolaimus sp. PS1159 TaxID=55785 RepID=A0AC35G560_9BILA